MTDAAGIADTSTLLAEAKPQLYEDLFVFVSLPEGETAQEQGLEPIAAFAEREGWSLVLEHGAAQERGLAYHGVFRLITLRVHSSLNAVGLTAALSGVLADAGIAANVIAAYHHDHVFVPAERADEALQLLQQMS